jgi:hypothetical protein
MFCKDRVKLFSAVMYLQGANFGCICKIMNGLLVLFENECYI